MDGFDPETAAAAVAAALRAAGTAERAEQEKRYLKSELDFFGVTVPEMRRVVSGGAGLPRAGRKRDGRLGGRAVAGAGARTPDGGGRDPDAGRAPAAGGRPGDGGTAAARVGNLGAGRRARGQRGGQIALRDPRSWPVIDGWAVDADFGCGGRRCSRCCAASAPGSRTCPGSPGTRSRCWRSGSSSSARRSAGCCGRSRGGPDWVAWTERTSRKCRGRVPQAVRRLPAAEAERLRNAR